MAISLGELKFMHFAAFFRFGGQRRAITVGPEKFAASAD
jgi:hypothetical protein